MEIRTPAPDDLDPLLDFFGRVPESERTFFKEHVLDRPTVEGWLTTDRGRRGLAFDEDGRVVGYVAVVPHSSWSDHVGDVRLVVDPERRTQGLGRALARSHTVADSWSAMATAGIDDALRAPGG
jgi:GNAT superfamily N-acetyltransferase